MSYIGNVVTVIPSALSGNLDVSGQDIVSSSNGNIGILPHGSGKVHLDGNGTSGGVLISDGLIEIKTGTGSVGEMRFYCETSNAHYTSLKSAAHGSYSGNVVLTLPATDGNPNEYLQTDGNGVLSFSSISLAADSVTYDMIQDTSDTDVVLGRYSSGAGTVQELSMATLKSIMGLVWFKNIAVSGQSDVVADSDSGDTLNLVAGSNITLTTDASTDSITIASSGGGGGGSLSGNLAGDIASNTHAINIADGTGGTANGRSPDSDVINIGASNDMQIFHNSSESTHYNIIKCNNQMDLKIVDDGYTQMALFERWGKVQLNNNGKAGVATDIDSNNYGTILVGGGSGATPYKLPGSIGSSGEVLAVPSSGTELEWTASGGGGGSSLTVQDEGGALSTAATTLNFVGSGVTASGTGATKTITIAGGGGGSSFTTLVIDETNANTAPQTNYTGYSGDGTIAIGSGGHSYGNYNVAIGYEAECQPYYGIPSMAKCVAVGYYAHADAYQSTAIGRQVTTAYGSNTATAVGASSDTSAAGGYGGAFATPMGTSNGQNDSIAIGRGAGTSGNWSMALCCSDTVTVSHDFSIYLTTRKDGVFNAQASTATSQISIGGNTHAIRFCENYTFPTSDGSSSGQQLTTDAAGTLSWAAASSDIRLKKNVSSNDMGLDFINDLDTKVYNFRSYKELDKSDPQIAHYKPLEYGQDGHDGATETEDDIPKNLTNKKGWQRGLIAQEVRATLDKYGHENFKGWGEDKHGVQEIYLEQFIVPLIKAVQELSEEVENLKAER